MIVMLVCMAMVMAVIAVAAPGAVYVTSVVGSTVGILVVSHRLS